MFVARALARACVSRDIAAPLVAHCSSVNEPQPLPRSRRAGARAIRARILMGTDEDPLWHRPERHAPRPAGGGLVDPLACCLSAACGLALTHVRMNLMLNCAEGNYALPGSDPVRLRNAIHRNVEPEEFATPTWSLQPGRVALSGVHPSRAR